MTIEGLILLVAVCAGLFAIGHWSLRMVEERKRSWQDFATRHNWRFRESRKDEELLGEVSGHAVRLSLPRNHDSPGFETGKLAIQLRDDVKADSEQSKIALENLRFYFGNCRTKLSDDQLKVEGLWTEIGRTATELHRSVLVVSSAASMLEGKLNR